MNDTFRPVLEPSDASAAPAPPPQVFVRSFAVPPGLPWEQTRAAQLEARHGAPLPIADLLHKCRRLARWAPGRPGRFAAFYIRAKEYRSPFETSVDVDGQNVRIAFGAQPTPLRGLFPFAAPVAMLVACGALVGGGAAMALNARATANFRLEALERRAAAQLGSATAQAERQARVRRLFAAAGRARPLDNVLKDLAWASASKAPEARIPAIHWDHGLLAVEVRGETEPFTTIDRDLEKSSKPIRDGVWLWGVRPSGARAAGARDTAFEGAAP